MKKYYCRHYNAYFKLSITCPLRKLWLKAYNKMPKYQQALLYEKHQNFSHCKDCEGAEKVIPLSIYND